MLALALFATPTAVAAAVTPQIVDGLGGGGGRVQARIAPDTASIVRGGAPWVFYGANPEYGYRLRLARLDATPTFVTLDGVGGGHGRTTHSVATDVSATAQAGSVHVFYRDDTDQDLRHGWFDGSEWTFETLDGDSTLDGRTSHDVGRRSVALVYHNKLNVIYADDTKGDVRRAVFDGSSWRYSVLDGNRDTGGRTTDPVGAAIRAGVWDSRLHVLYTVAPSGLREATIDRGRSAAYATLSSSGGSSLGLLKVSDARVLIAYDATIGSCCDGGFGPVSAGVWNGSTWSVDRPVSRITFTEGLTIFADGGRPFLASGVWQCDDFGCDQFIGVAPWNGTTFDDPYRTRIAGGHPPGFPSSAVTIGGVGHLYVGAFGYQSEPDIYDQALLSVEGPF